MEGKDCDLRSLGAQAVSSARFIRSYFAHNLTCLVKPSINICSDSALVPSSVKWLKIPRALSPAPAALWEPNLIRKESTREEQVHDHVGRWGDWCHV